MPRRVYHMSRDTAFPTRLQLHPMKTLISLRFRAVWSVFAVRLKTLFILGPLTGWLEKTLIRLHRLIWVSAGSTHSIVGNAVPRLSCDYFLFSVLSGLDCFQCYSFNKTDPHCGDPFHPAYGNYVKDCTAGKEGRIGKFPARHCIKLIGTTGKHSASFLRKSTSGRHRPVSYPDGPMMARYRFT